MVSSENLIVLLLKLQLSQLASDFLHLDLLVTPHPEVLEDVLQTAVESDFSDTGCAGAESWSERWVGCEECFLRVDVLLLVAVCLRDDDSVFLGSVLVDGHDGVVATMSTEHIVEVDFWHREEVSEVFVRADRRFGLCGEQLLELWRECGVELGANECHGCDLRDVRGDFVIGQTLL